MTNSEALSEAELKDTLLRNADELIRALQAEVTKLRLTLVASTEEWVTAWPTEPGWYWFYGHSKRHVASNGAEASSFSRSDSKRRERFLRCC